MLQMGGAIRILANTVTNNASQRWGIPRHLIGNEISQERVTLPQRLQAFVEASFVRSIFHFDADRAAIATVGQCRKEAAPVYVTHAG